MYYFKAVSIPGFAWFSFGDILAVLLSYFINVMRQKMSCCDAVDLQHHDIALSGSAQALT